MFCEKCGSTLKEGSPFNTEVSDAIEDYADEKIRAKDFLDIIGDNIDSGMPSNMADKIYSILDEEEGGNPKPSEVVAQEIYDLLNRYAY